MASSARERQYAEVFSDAPDAMLVLNHKRIVVEANRAAHVLFGGGSRDLVGQPLSVLLDGISDELDTAWNALEAQGAIRCEHRVVGPDGQLRSLECSYRALTQSRRFLCVARDTTDARLLEARVTQSEKIESVGRLAGGIAHDFNNLLTAILGYTELLIASKPPDDPDRPDLEEVQKAGQRAASLTQQLLAFSRKQVLQPKEVDLNQTVTALKTMLSRLIREDIILGCEVAPGTAFVRIDPIQIEQALLNLVLNARDALPSGGYIRLEVARLTREQVHIPQDVVSVAEEYVRLRVIDNGMGMSPETCAHIFEPFFTTKAQGKGTGLGLASVHGIVRQSNGFITVDSEVGRGTMFSVFFPAVLPGRDAAAVDPKKVAAPGHRETILLVEDEDAVRVILGAMLRRQGYHVLEAATPTSALTTFAEHAPSIDLLVTDVIMPEMNGPALAQRLVAERPELRILFISGYANIESPLDSSNPNIGFLAKPFEAAVLASKVSSILTQRRSK